MKTPTVWVVKEQTILGPNGAKVMNLAPAMAYGEIEFITRTDMPLYPRSSVQLTWDNDVQDFVSKYDERTDFIIATGQPTAIFAVGHALGRVGKAPRYLVWKREENRYRVLDLMLTPA